VPDVQVGRRRIEARFDAQWAAGFQPVDQFGFDQEFVAAALDDFELLGQRCHGGLVVNIRFFTM